MAGQPSCIEWLRPAVKAKPTDTAVGHSSVSPAHRAQLLAAAKSIYLV